MAEILTFSIRITVTNGSFTGGDEITIFYDDVADDIVVYQNASPISSGPTLLTSQTITESENYGFCDGDDLIRFGLVDRYINPFPYVEKAITENSPTCTGATCDIVINNIQLINDTGSGDGQAIVSATSSNGVIKYKLQTRRGGRFDYNNDGQTSNIFTGLSPGNYIIAVKDENGCVYEESFTIALGASYSTRFICEFDNIKNETQVLIQQRQYEGEPTQVCMSETFIIDYPNKSFDSFYNYTLWPSRFQIGLLSETDQQYISLYTEQHKRFRAIVSRGGVEVWRGYIQPNTFSEPYIPPLYVTNLEFIDGLAMLERKKITDYNFDGASNLMQYISIILSEIGLGIDINVAINVYSAGMDSNLSVLPQVLLSAIQFDRDKDLTAYEALEWILKPFGCMLTQYAGAWWIIRHDQRGSEFTYYNFNEAGVYQGSDTFDPVINMNCPTVGNRIVNINRDAFLDIMPSFGQIILTDKFSLKDSLLNNWDFESLDDLSSSGMSYWTFFLAGSTQVYAEPASTPLGNSLSITSKLDDNTDPRSAYILSTPITVKYTSADKFRFRVKFSFSNFPNTVPFAILQLQIKFDSDVLGYDLKDWDSTNEGIRLYPNYEGGFAEATFEFKAPTSSGINTKTVSVRINNANVYTPEYDDTFNIATIPTVDLPIGYKIDKEHPTYNVRVQYYELIAGNDGDVTPSDYDAGTNDKNWKLIDEASINGRQQAGEVSIFYIDEVEIDYLPNGENPVEEQVTPFEINLENPEVFDAELNVGGLPFNYDQNTELTVNDIYQYDSKFYGPSNVFFNQWGRKGLDEAVRLQILYINTLIEQHITATSRITGTFTTQELGFVGSPGTPLDVSPLNCVYDSYSEKYYIVVSYSAYDKDRAFGLELVELKAGDAQNEFGAFSDGFSDGFS